jgi:hypothetical protein
MTILFLKKSQRGVSATLPSAIGTVSGSGAEIAISHFPAFASLDSHGATR